MTGTVPVVLFAYARPDLLRRTLGCLRENRVPLIHAFSDGPRTAEQVPAVARVRSLLRAIDWCEVVLRERVSNLGLGRSVRAGVTDVLATSEMAIVFEDDLVCVPGTYDYLCAALQHYRADPRVMSVTGWTNPRIIPPGVIDQPYFDGKAESWVWGTTAAAWRGMHDDALTLMGKAAAAGVDVHRFGPDLPAMAAVEAEKNIWAVRWLYWHILNRGLCVRPPWSMVEHIGFGAGGTNCTGDSWLANPPLKPCPPIPGRWPEPVEHPACAELWRRVGNGGQTLRGRLSRMARRAQAWFRGCR